MKKLFFVVTFLVCIAPFGYSQSEPIQDTKKDFSTGEWFWGAPGSLQPFWQIYYPKSCVEIILYADEMNGPMTIQNFAFQNGGYYGQTTFPALENVSIFIKHCGDTRFINPDEQLIDTATAHKYLANSTVFNGSEFINYRDWCVFALDKPFEYNGTENIHIAFVFDGETGRMQNFLTTYIAYDAVARNGVGGAKSKIKYAGDGDINSTNGVTYGDIQRYFPFTCFNKKDENGNVITQHRVLPYTDKQRAVLPNYIYTAPSAGNDGTTTTAPTSNYWTANMPNSFYNCIYSPAEMGNGVFGNAERTINALVLQTGQSVPTSFDNTIYESSIPIEIYLRLTDESTVEAAQSNASPPSYYESVSNANEGWQIVYNGTYPVSHYTKRMRLPLMNSFKYDGTSNVELLMIQKNRRPGVTSEIYYYQYFHTPTGGAIPVGQRPARYAYTATSNWVTTNMNLSAIWEYESAEQVLETINFSPPSSTEPLSSTEYMLFQAELSTSGTWNPRKFNSLSFNIAKNVPNNIFENITIYTTGNNSNFSAADARPVGVIEDIEGNAITITADESNPDIALKDGVNYYWIVAKLNCARSISATFGLANINEIDITGAAGTPFTKPNFTFRNGQDWPVDTAKFEVMTALEHYPALVCASRENNDYAVELSQNVEAVIWQRFENNTWNTIQAENAFEINHVTVLNIKTSDVEKGLNKYRLIATPTGEAAGTCVTTLTKDYTFERSAPARQAAITVAGAPSVAGTPYYHCVGGVPLVFYAAHTNSASEYEWEYRDATTGNAWQPIPINIVPSARSREMAVTPRYDWTILRDSYIRVKITSELACDITNPWVEYSAPVQLIVPSENKVTSDLPSVLEVCRNTQLVLSPQFESAGVISYQWYHDTVALQGQTRAQLVIPEVQLWDKGNYRLEIITLGCQNADGIDTIRTGKCVLTVAPGPEIVWQNTQTRANLGDFAVMQIESDYDMVEPGEEDVVYFQWYRHNELGNIDIKLDDNNTYFGTTSNNLVITPLSQSDYTFSGDYYYCESFGACGSGFGGVRSAPILLLPGDNLSVISHPKDAAVCASDTAVFEFEVWSNGRDADVVYQWFLDGDTLSDDATYSGATGPELRVNLSSGAGVSGDYVCQAWFAGSDPSLNSLRSRAAVVVLQELDAPPAEADTVRVLAGSLVEFHTDYLPNVPVLSYEIIFTDLADAVDTISTGAGFAGDYSLSAAQVSDAGQYVLRLFGQCNSIEIAWILEVEGSDDGPLAPTSIADFATDFDLTVHPNPASSELIFSFAGGSEGKYSAEILDLSGAVVWAGSGALSGRVQLNLDVNALHLSNGSYVFRVAVGGRLARYGFVVAR